MSKSQISKYEVDAETQMIENRKKRDGHWLLEGRVRETERKRERAREIGPVGIGQGRGGVSRDS